MYENNYLKYIKNDTDDRIKAKINIIRIEFAQLQKTSSPKNIELKLEKHYMKQKIKQNLTKHKKMRYTTVLVNFSRDLDMTRKYGYSDSGINDIEFLYSNPNDYYRPILAKHAFYENYELYTCRGDKNKELQTH